MFPSKYSTFDIRCCKTNSSNIQMFWLFCVYAMDDPILFNMQCLCAIENVCQYVLRNLCVPRCLSIFGVFVCDTA